MFENNLDCHSLGVWCYCHLARNGATHLTMHKEPSTAKNVSVYNADSTEVETSTLEDSKHSELCNLLRMSHLHRECYLGQEDKATAGYD